MNRSERRASERAPACLGGWCRLRVACSRYVADSDLDPIERICEHGRDGVSSTYPVSFVRRVGSWERRMVPSMLRPADPFDMVGAA